MAKLFHKRYAALALATATALPTCFVQAQENVTAPAPPVVHNVLVKCVDPDNTRNGPMSEMRIYDNGIQIALPPKYSQDQRPQIRGTIGRDNEFVFAIDNNFKDGFCGVKPAYIDVVGAPGKTNNLSIAQKVRFPDEVVVYHGNRLAADMLDVEFVNISKFNIQGRPLDLKNVAETDYNGDRGFGPRLEVAVRELMKPGPLVDTPEPRGETQVSSVAPPQPTGAQ